MMSEASDGSPLAPNNGGTGEESPGIVDFLPAPPSGAVAPLLGAGGASDGTAVCKPPLWADILLTLWVIVVGVFYFGGFFFPAIGGRTAVGAAFYALMIFVSVLTLALRFLRTVRPQK